MSKNRIKKGIESIDKQIALHKEKLKKAKSSEDTGLTEYYEKELDHFEQIKEKKKKKLVPKLKRKK